ncbi:iron-siderophore ABC transporter substrate-binding protein [Homoserinibacter gongjuensis]|uniref:ABC transporter substrate-binding protein n=1 Tax=Homoserinibacter gongjuensis TaxID=1162968 RepID=A0ABQ6JML3_9MICO|nr:iron-siderophore ABC transporter substrate-binding protein [Homoserinibacter gongjuensis]GMA89520.1 ABC transporter substrate-binding protein [Homoserinibacter gongjuensis]GMA93161.1 ABC transporter substrate-binding protein [Homoserinibacter gongjuensis]
MRALRCLPLVLAAAVALTACAGPTADTAAEGPRDDAAFPVTIEHAFGETTISQKPVRVATVSWSNQEVPLALGVVPVGMAAVSWGDDDGDGVLPWVEDRLAELGADTPVLFDETDGIDFEAVNDTRPDVILAGYSGLTQEEYDTLSKIAPVVAYPQVAWGTSLEDMIRIDAKALGLDAEADAFIDELHGEIDAALEANAVIRDKKILFSFIDPSDFSQIGFYTSLDTRPGFLAGLGLPEPSIVQEESAGSDAFYTSVSAEQAERFADVDIFVTYGDPDGDLVERMQADPLLSKIPAIAAGHVVILPDSTPLAAAANPSPLSIGYNIGDYLALFAAQVG